VKDIFTFIADQRADDLHQYDHCLELVSRGLVSGKVQVMVESLRRLMDEGSGTEMVTAVNGDVIFIIYVFIVSFCFCKENSICFNSGQRFVLGRH